MSRRTCRGQRTPWQSLFSLTPWRTWESNSGTQVNWLGSKHPYLLDRVTDFCDFFLEGNGFNCPSPSHSNSIWFPHSLSISRKTFTHHLFSVQSLIPFQCFVFIEPTFFIIRLNCLECSHSLHISRVGLCTQWDQPVGYLWSMLLNGSSDHVGQASGNIGLI